MNDNQMGYLGIGLLILVTIVYLLLTRRGPK